MANETVSELDPIPKMLPRFGLWRARYFNQVTSDLDMTTENDRSIWSCSLGNWDQPWHLRVVNDHYVRAALRRRK
jgi:hypothetical protein